MNAAINSKLYQGMSVAGAAMIGVFMTTPGQTVGVTSFIDPIAADLGIDRGQVLLLYSIGTLLGILPAPYVGRIVDRHGPRVLIVPTALAVGLACVAMSSARGHWSLVVGFVLLRGAAIGGLSLVSLHMINLWFDRLRGSMTAFAMMGLALGGMILPQIAEAIIEAQGWRAAYLMLGGAVVVVMLPIGLLFFRNKSDDDSLCDFGHPGSAPTTSNVVDLTLKESARTKIFWYLVLIGCLVNAVGTALLLDHSRVMLATGIGRERGIQLLGAITVAQAIATLIAGRFVDRFGARPTGLLGLALLMFTVGCVSATPTIAGGLAYGMSLGATIGVLQLVSSAGLGQAFGTKHLGSIRGVTFAVGVAGAAAGPLPFIWSPSAGYWLFVVAAAFTIVLGVAAQPSRSLMHA